MNSAGILVYYIMKTQPHAQPNLQLVIFKTLPDVVLRHFWAFPGILRYFKHYGKNSK